MLPAFKAALFDMDGTLTHTMRYWRLAPLEFALAHDVVPTAEEYTELRLNSSRVMTERFRVKYGIPLSEEAVQSEIEDIVYHHYLFDAKPMENVEDFLKYLDSQNIAMCIATGTPRQNAQALMKRLGYEHYFKFITGGYDYQLTKRSSEYFVMMSRKLGVEPGELCVFEDALYALQSAKEAGCITCAIEEPLQAADRDAIMAVSDIYAKSYTELLQMAQN